MSKSPITCHVLDSSLGKPAKDVFISLHSTDGGPDTFLTLAEGATNADGRCLDLLPAAGSQEEQNERTALTEGRVYKIIFHTAEYFERTERQSFYPWVEISFTITNAQEHYHIPLVISPYGFTTYRGS